MEVCTVSVNPYAPTELRESHHDADACGLARKHESILVGDDKNPGVYEQLRRMKWWGGLFGSLAVAGIWALVLLTYVSTHQ